MVNDRPFLAFFEKIGGTYQRISKLRKESPIAAGKTSETIILYVKNITPNELFDIHISVADTEVEVSPSKIQKLNAGEMVAITFVWRPSLNRRTALKTKLNSVATEVIKPR